MEEKTLKEKTAKGLFWGGISNGIQQVLLLIFGIILARTLTPSDYGIVAMLSIFTAIAGTIQDSGFSVALINRSEIRDEDYNAVFWFNLFTSIFLYLILFFFAPVIADFYNKPELCLLARVLFVSFIFSALGMTHGAMLSKKLMIKEKAKIDIYSLIASGFIGVLMALNGYGYWGLAIQNITYIGVGCVLRWYYSTWKPSFQIDFSPLKEMFGFSIKLFFTNIFTQISNNIFSVILGRYYNDKQVGYYSQGYKWMSMGSGFVGGIMNGVAHPVLVEANESIGYKKKVFRKMMRMGAFISFPLVLGLAFVGKEFVYITVGSKWLPSVPFLQLFCIWGAFIYMWNLYVSLLMSLGKSNIYMGGMIFVGILQLSVIISMFTFGIIPMVIAYIVTFFLGLVLWQFFAYRLIHVSVLEVVGDILPYLLISLLSFAIAGVCTCQMDNIYWSFVLKVIISVIAYVSIVWLSGSVLLRESVNLLKDKFYA